MYPEKCNLVGPAFAEILRFRQTGRRTDMVLLCIIVDTTNKIYSFTCPLSMPRDRNPRTKYSKLSGVNFSSGLNLIGSGTVFAFSVGYIH